MLLSFSVQEIDRLKGSIMQNFASPITVANEWNS